MASSQKLRIAVYDTLNRVGENGVALGYLRYEAIRKLNPRQFQELCQRNLEGEFFDDLVDKLIQGLISFS